MEHKHPVVDSDSRFIINPDSRRISTTSTKLELVQGDHQSERITFEIPRIVEGHDMSLCDRIEIHYINIDRKTKTQSKDIYIADDVSLDGEKVLFSWLISGNATKYYGRLNFIVLFECLDDNGNYTYKWSTEICKLLTVGEGISNTEAVTEDYSDILEKFRKEILGDFQPDWNQNDEKMKGYIKNRPGGYTIGTFSTTTLNITYSTKISDNKYSIGGDNFVYTSDSGYVSVEYDGILYENVPVLNPDQYGGYNFGDLQLVAYPFYFNSNAYMGGGNYSPVAYVTKENPIIKITTWVITDIKIPSKYIESIKPDWNQSNESAEDFIKNKPKSILKYSDQSMLLSDSEREIARNNIQAVRRARYQSNETLCSIFGESNISGSGTYVYYVSASSGQLSWITLKPDRNKYSYSSTYLFDVDNPGFILDFGKEFTPSETTKDVYVVESNGSEERLYYIQSFRATTSYGLSYYGVEIKKTLLDSISDKNRLLDDRSKYAFVVGNGLHPLLRSNAYTLDWNGNAWFSGDVYTGSTSRTNRDEGSKKLATEEYVDSQKFSGSYNDLTDIPTDVIINSSTPDSTKKFKITVDDSGTISAVEIP